MAATVVSLLVSCWVCAVFFFSVMQLSCLVSVIMYLTQLLSCSNVSPTPAREVVEMCIACVFQPQVTTLPWQQVRQKDTVWTNTIIVYRSSLSLRYNAGEVEPQFSRCLCTWLLEYNSTSSALKESIVDRWVEGSAQWKRDVRFYYFGENMG